MTRIILEIPKEQDVTLILELLKRLGASVIKQEEVDLAEEPAEFYQQFQVDMSDFTFNREEANER